MAEAEGTGVRVDGAPGVPAGDVRDGGAGESTAVGEDVAAKDGKADGNGTPAIGMGVGVPPGPLPDAGVSAGVSVGCTVGSSVTVPEGTVDRE